MTATLSSGVTSLAYRAQQLSLLVPAAVAQRVVRLVGRASAPRPSTRELMALRRRYEGLIAKDLQNARDGLYPRKLLFSMPVATYAKALPQLFADFPRSIRRRVKGDWRGLPGEVDARAYPPYFRRTFHWQTDGYLSKRSAELYDVGVEFLFAGMGDVMRRQVIPPITRWLSAHGGAKGKRLLDVACGTGRTLAQIHEAHPELKLYGLDLSPYYLQQARQTLADVPDVSLVAENAEHMPFAGELFDVVTSTYLFHELPRNARRNVVRDAARVLSRGGLFVIEDSGQLAESEEIGVFLERFPVDFHEPFYADYLRDDLRAMLESEGFEVEEVEPCFVAKVVVARKR
ncbi:MAG: class I SAM-dependent methyltransferase [Sandaracinaceae bacterium]|nr:class I SAM-dependent methyltransferase [Sandaracinaceae bacterium]